MSKILFVDDEIKVLEGYRRAFRKDVEIETALGGAEAINLIKRRGPYSVIVSDMCMPGMNGIEFLSQAKLIHPKTVRIMLTGKADQQTAIDAVNKGNIFRFLTKPCSSDMLYEVISEGIKLYEKDKSETKLLENERRYRTVVENIKGVIFQTDNLGRLTFINSVWTLLTGFSVEESLGIELANFVHERDKKNTTEQIHWLLNGVKHHSNGKIRLITKNGGFKVVEAHNKVTLDTSSSQIIGLTGTLYEIKHESHEKLIKGRSLEGDIEETRIIKKDAESLKKSLLFKSSMDFYECQKILWNSPARFYREIDKIQHSKDRTENTHSNFSNRAYFLDCIRKAIHKRGQNEDNQFAVLIMDLDRFNVVNVSLGHSIGDKLLLEITERVKTCLQGNDIITRFGSDDFAILLNGIKSVEEASIIARRIQSSLTSAFMVDENEILASISIGIVYSDDSYKQADEIVRDAELALSEAKTRGRSQYKVFNKEMYSRIVSKTRLEMELSRAVELNEFCQYYQPILSLYDRRLIGFEALLRWQHTTRGIIPPAEFISALEKNGLIVHVGLGALKEACKQMVLWQQNSKKQLTLNVNFSANLFMQPDLVNQVAAILFDTKFEPENLNIEITETILMENWQNILDCLNSIRKLGVKLSIDDFGTGYSSLSYLQTFPVRELKIDRAFVCKIEQSSEDIEIVRAIISLAKNIGLETVAEGIETEQQLSILRELGCKFGQGFLFAKPVPADAAKFLITQFK